MRFAKFSHNNLGCEIGLCDLLGLPLLDDLLGLLLDAARRHGLGHLVADVEEFHLVEDVWQQRLLQIPDHLTRDQQHR